MKNITTFQLFYISVNDFNLFKNKMWFAYAMNIIFIFVLIN